MRRVDVLSQIPDAWMAGVVRLGRSDKRPVDVGFNTTAAERWETGAPDDWRGEIEAWIEQGGNVGMVPPPGVVCIDCDNREAVEFVGGFAALETPRTQRTPEKAHFWFRYTLPPTARNWKSKGATLDNGAKLDLRVAGKSQAVIPPSQGGHSHAPGVSTAWIVPLPDLVEQVPMMPAELRDELIAAGLSQARDRDPASIPTGENAHDTVRDWIMSHVDSAESEGDLYEMARRFAESYVEPMRPGRYHAMVGGRELGDLVSGAWRLRGRGELPRLVQMGQGDDRHVWLWRRYFEERWAHVGEWSHLGSWVQWDGEVWRHRPEKGDNGFFGAMQRYAQTLKRLRDRDDPNLPDHGAFCTALDALRTEMARTRSMTGPMQRLEQALAAESGLFDQQTHLWVCPGDPNDDTPAKTLDLVQHIIRPPDPDDMLTQKGGAAFRPKVRSSVWEDFITEAVPDVGLRAYLQTAVGYTMLGEPKEDVVFFLIGRGGSGKSSFLGALQAVFGNYAGELPAAEVDDKTAGAGAGAANATLVSLRGKRIVTSAELPDRVRLGAKLKALSGGDQVSSRGLYARTPTIYRPQFVIWLGGNFQPEAKAVDSGLTRRMRYIPMETVPKKRDPMVRVRLKRDPDVRSAILNWAIEGLRNYLTNGLVTPEIVTNRSLRARSESSDLGPWLREWVMEDETAQGFTVAQGLDSYTEWYLEAHHTRRGINIRTLPRFGEEMAALGHKSVRVRVDGQVARCYKGLRILTHGERLQRDSNELL